jgi:hypothetical protein
LGGFFIDEERCGLAQRFIGGRRALILGEDHSAGIRRLLPPLLHRCTSGRDLLLGASVSATSSSWNMRSPVSTPAGGSTRASNRMWHSASGNPQ